MFLIHLLKYKNRIAFWRTQTLTITLFHIWEGNIRSIHEGTILCWYEMPTTNPLGEGYAQHQPVVDTEPFSRQCHFCAFFADSLTVRVLPSVGDPWPSGSALKAYQYQVFVLFVCLIFVFCFHSKVQCILKAVSEPYIKGSSLSGQCFSILLNCLSHCGNLPFLSPRIFLCWKHHFQKGYALACVNPRTEYILQYCLLTTWKGFI